MIEYPTTLDELAGHNVRKLGWEEGDITQIGDVRLTWKARGETTGLQFAVHESELPPGAGVPLHKHPFAEFFYVLEGDLAFGRVGAEGAWEWLACGAGECVLAPPNAPHGARNSSGQPARFLSVANFQHELMLTDAGRFVAKHDPPPTPPDAAEFARLSRSFAKHQSYWVELGSGAGQ